MYSVKIGTFSGFTEKSPILGIFTDDFFTFLNSYMEVFSMAQKVQFVETVLRDANQSLIATRLPFEKFEPMLETIDKAGYYAAEC